MNIRGFNSRTLALAIALSLSATAAWAVAPTSNAQPAHANASHPAPASRAFLKFSESANLALPDIRAPRSAIFDGHTDAATKLMGDAKMEISKAESEAPEFATTTSTVVDGKTVSSNSTKLDAVNVPVDGQLMVADDFVVSPEKKAHIDKADEHMKNGDKAKAIEELRLADIDVNYTRVWMPMATSERHLSKAIQLANDGKYYEANLALKSITDNLFVDSIDINGLPTKSKKS